MIHVLATIELVEGTREAFLVELHRIVAAVRAEKGCLEYGPAIDVPTGIAAQAPPRTDTVMVIEKWESVEALQAHLVAPHMQEYRGRVKDFVRKVTLQVLAPA
jgi:quinol monooxygenase YgiN